MLIEQKMKMIYMIISIEVEKTLDKVQHPYMIKPFKKVGIEGRYQ